MLSELEILKTHLQLFELLLSSICLIHLPGFQKLLQLLGRTKLSLCMHKSVSVSAGMTLGKNREWIVCAFNVDYLNT